MDNGSAPGVSGWTPNFIRHLSKHPRCALAISHIITDLINGKIEDDIRSLFTDSLLILVSKPLGGYRPIAITECFLRLAARVASNLLPDSTTLFPSGIQLHKAPGGCTSALIRLQAALEAVDDSYCLSVDFVNAFNSRDRSRIAEVLFADPNFAPIQRLFNFIYKAPSTLHFSNGLSSIQSNNGCLQGEGLASYAFSKSVDDLYAATRDSGSVNATAAAIVDDFNMVDGFDGIKSAWSKLKSLCADENITINFPKTRLLSPFSSDPVAESFCLEHNITLIYGALPLLGGSIGRSTQSRASISQEKLDQLDDKFFRVVASSSLPEQVCSRFLQASGIPLASYIASTTPPSVNKPILDAFDSKIIAAFGKKLNISSEDLSTPENIIRCSFPNRFGGRGFRSQAEFAPIYYLISVTRAVEFFPNNLVRLLKSRPTPIPLFSEIARIRNDLLSRFPGLSPLLPICDPITSIPSFNPLASSVPFTYAKHTSRSLAGRIVDHIETFKMNSLKEHHQTSRVLLRSLEAFSNPLARRIFGILGRTQEQRLSPEDCSTFNKFYFHIPFKPDPPPFCVCGQEFTFDHPLSCLKLRRFAVTHRHDLVKSSVGKGLSDNGYTVHYERRIWNVDRLRPDLLFTTSIHSALESAFGEISIIHTDAPSYTHSAVPTQLANRARVKVAKYAGACTRANRLCHPLILSSLGVFGSDFTNFITKLGKVAFSTRRSLSPALSAYNLVDNVLIALHTGNARILSSGFELASHPPAEATSSEYLLEP